MLFLYTEPIHCSSDETSLVEWAANLEDVAFNFHRTVVCLSVAWIVDRTSSVLIASLLEIVEHIEAENLTCTELWIRIEVVHCRSTVCLVRFLEPYDLAVEYVSLLVNLYDGCAVFKFPFSDYVLSECRRKGSKHENHADKKLLHIT